MWRRTGRYMWTEDDRLKRGGVRVTLYPAFGNLRSKSRRLGRSVLQENGLWPATEAEERDADGDWEKVRVRWTLSGGQREQGRRAGALIRALCSEPSARSDRPDRRQRSMGASSRSGCSGGLDRTRLLSLRPDPSSPLSSSPASSRSLSSSLPTSSLRSHPSSAVTFGHSTPPTPT